MRGCRVRGKGIRIALWIYWLLAAIRPRRQRPGNPVRRTGRSDAHRASCPIRRLWPALLPHPGRQRTRAGEASGPAQIAACSRTAWCAARWTASPAPGFGSPNPAAGVEGAIWDGHDLYAVTSYARIAASANYAARRHARPDRDLQALRHARRAAAGLLRARRRRGRAKSFPRLDQYQAHGRRARRPWPAGNVTRQLEISLIGDGDFAAAEPRIPPPPCWRASTSSKAFSANSWACWCWPPTCASRRPRRDPFTSTRAVTLLDQLGRYRRTPPRCARAASRTW